MFLLTNHVSVRVSHALFIWSTGEYKSLCEEKYNHYVFTRKQETMSQSLLKCTICGGDHYIFHCINKCGVCSGDNRQCSCPAQPPQKRRGRPSRAINSLKISRATKGLKKVRHFGERPREGGPVLPKPTTTESRACCRVGGTRKRCGGVGQSSANKVRGHQDSAN